MRRFLPLPLLLLLFLPPAAGTYLENFRLDLEFTTQAKCLLEASSFLKTGGALPSLRLEVRALPSGSSLRSTVEGEAGGLPGGWENLLFFSPQLLNSFLSLYEGKTLREIREGSGALPAIRFEDFELPRGMENLVLEEIEVRELRRLDGSVGFSVLLVLGGVERRYLPSSFWLSLEEAGEGAFLSVRAEFSLPRQGNRVVVTSLPLPPRELLEGISLENFSLTLRVPEGAEISGLPEGFENREGTYSFSGENMELFQALLEGLGGMSLSYECPSPSFPILPLSLLLILLSLLLGKAFLLRRGKGAA